MPLVVWSGGADSTLLLHRVARQSYGDDNWPVRVISVYHSNITNSKAQIKARKKILKVFHGMNYYLEPSTMTIKDTSRWGGGGYGFAQAPIWIYAAVTYAKKKDDVYMGYITTDGVWPYWHTIETAFQSMAKILDKDLTLHVPLKNVEKVEVIERLQKISKEYKLPKKKRLESLVLFCCKGKAGLQKGCTCDSCNRHREALLILKHRKKRNKKGKK